MSTVTPIRPEIQIIQVDPFHPQLGHLFPFILRRFLEFAQIHYEEISPMAQAKDYGARLVAADPKLYVQAFISQEGALVGHSVAEIMEFAGKKWLFVAQCKLDVPGGDCITRALAEGEAWAAERGCTLILMSTARSDSAWVKQFGFHTIRHIMGRPIEKKKGS